MRRISPQHKKGVSEIISYTLLIVIAITASILVYNFLKLSTPKDRPVCSDDISLVVFSADCKFLNLENTEINLSLQNKGKFTIDAAFVRIGVSGRETSERVSAEDESDLYFPGGLLPDKVSIPRKYVLESSSIVKQTGNYILEIQPAMFDDSLGKLAVCPNAIITQNVECK